MAGGGGWGGGHGWMYSTGEARGKDKRGDASRFWAAAFSCSCRLQTVQRGGRETKAEQGLTVALGMPADCGEVLRGISWLCACASVLLARPRVPSEEAVRVCRQQATARSAPMPASGDFLVLIGYRAGAGGGDADTLRGGEFASRAAPRTHTCLPRRATDSQLASRGQGREPA